MTLPGLLNVAVVRFPPSSGGAAAMVPLHVGKGRIESMGLFRRRSFGRAFRIFTVALLFFRTSANLRAEDKPKPPDDKPLPKIIVALPLGITSGATAKITIRGLGLDQATEIQFDGGSATAKILSKGKVAIPDKSEAKDVGDTQIEVEVVLPGDTAPGELPFTVAAPAGRSQPHSILIAAKDKLVTGKKPGGGFRDALPLALGQSFDGAIERAKEVHVFRIGDAGGKKIVAEVAAARKGSSLDSMLTLYDSAGHILATNDDFGGTADSHLETTLPTTGHSYLSLIDANDQASPLHVYRLTIEEAR